ncbi:MAG: hypothetical protein ACAF41_16355 [Leptolyngbya sp. BL-A-14]
MKCSLDATEISPNKIERLKVLMGLLAKAKAFQTASVRVAHHYTQPEWEQNFTLETLACGTGSYMRGRGGTIQQGDHIVLQTGSHTARYHVDEIDYEAAPSGFWIALLNPCSELSTDCRFWMQPVDQRG